MIPAVPIKAPSSGTVTSVSTSSGANPGASVKIVTVGFTDLSYLAITLVFAGIMLAGFIVNLVLGGVLALMEARSQRHMF